MSETEITAGSQDVLALLSQTDSADLVQSESKEDVAAIVKSGEWLPRIAICGGSTELVKQGKLPMGVLAIIHDKNNFKDLGKQIDFAVLAFRAKAMRFTGKPLSYFDRTTDEFKAIQRESTKKNSGCGWGPEFLIWLPSENTFATYFCSNPTMRNAAPDLMTIMKKGVAADGREIYGPAAASSEMHYIDGDENSWWAARFLPHTTPLPTVDDPAAWSVKMQEEVKKFKNPPKSLIEVETVADAPATAGRAR